ncbi:MAG TPA: phosphatase PAP2 family protein [Flavisolibacter sp.]|nr:phosphatase PAP2 family protein [Flavisolibacter sp.]
MKQLILLLTILFLNGRGYTQTNQQRLMTTYDAAHWKTRLVTNPDQITCAAVPGAAASKAELKQVKQRLAANNKETLAAINYWNAGAPAYRWNQIISAMAFSKPELQLRMPGSWINLAIYDATILAWKEKSKYKRARPQDADPSIRPLVQGPSTYSYPCEHTVTAAAAATVLAYFFPEKKDSLLQLAHAASQSRIDAGVQYPSDAEAGWKLGEQVALQVIEKAKNDGSAAKWDGKMNTDPKKWTGSYPFGITLTAFTPLVLRSADQFRPPAPPDFEADMKEMKSFKQTFSTKAKAYYWASTADAWTELAGKKLFEYGMMDNAPAAARVYAVLNCAYHDMAIAIMDAKYAYWGIRPNQYDTTFKSLIPTPPFPGYPSGHAAGAATSCAVMEYFFPADAAEFHRMAQECADSRFYAGIHFRTDNEVALRMGDQLGKYIVQTWMKE